MSSNVTSISLSTLHPLPAVPPDLVDQTPLSYQASQASLVQDPGYQDDL